MPDGSKHYVNAERLPNYSEHFKRVRSWRDSKPGDLLVLDWLGQKGEGGAHVEIIMELGPSGLRSLSAVNAGIQERAYDARYLDSGHRGRAELYFLRPRKS